MNMKKRSGLAFLGSALFSQFAIAQAPSPAGGLASNHNYIFSNDCKPVTDLSVSVHATKDIVGPKGIGVQLNSTSPPQPPGTPPHGPPTVFQQYMMGIGYRPSINWDIQNFAKQGQLLSVGDPNFVPMPNVILPAGYTLKISLENDKNGNITGVTFVAIDRRGRLLKTKREMLLGIQGCGQVGGKCGEPGQAGFPRVTEAYFAPINAFQLNLVGPSGGQILSSGAGTITYAASSPMTASNQFPKAADGQLCVATTTATAEQANTFYAVLPSGPSNTFTQPFGIAPPEPCAAGEFRVFPSELCVGPGAKTVPPQPPVR
jgi:hypothetical protein